MLPLSQAATTAKLPPPQLLGIVVTELCSLDVLSVAKPTAPKL